MPSQIEPTIAVMNSSHPVLRYGLAYLLWFVTIAVSLLIIGAIRDTYRILMALAQWRSTVVRLTDEFSILFLGLIILVLIILTEHMYRTAVPARKLTRVACGLLTWLLAILGSLHMIQLLLELQYGDLDLIRLGVIAVDFGLAILLWWWRHRIFT